MMRLVPLQRGHSNGFNSCTCFITAAQLEEALGWWFLNIELLGRCTALFPLAPGSAGPEAIVPPKRFVGVRYAARKKCQKLQGIKLMRRAVFGGVSNNIVLN